MLAGPAIRWTLMAAALLLLLSALALWSWGRFAAGARGPASSALPVQPADSAHATPLDRAVEPLLQAHAGQSAAALVTDNVQAFVLRAHAARQARRSLDVQYYIWHNDLTGNLLRAELLAAARRGVRVRVLLDDVNATGRDDMLLLLDAHPLLEVRLFNPGRNRAAGWRRAAEMLLRFVSFNRRMHNKAWIADNRVALVGGRNVGDEYFDAAAQVNFHDADLALLGPAVAQASEVFDDFWNSAEVVPLAALHALPGEGEGEAAGLDADGLPAAQARRLRQWQRHWQDRARASAWWQALGEGDGLAARLAGQMQLHWSQSIRVISDPPQKAAALDADRQASQWLVYDVLKLLFSAERESWLVSPYFVPGDAAVLALAGQTHRGVSVQVLTNSLAANDVPLVHAGYMAYRRPLLAAGVRLFELKRAPSGGGLAADKAKVSEKARDWLGSSGASLHTKAMVVDGRRGFVGSFNFDPRSAQLNTEMGVWFDHEPLAQQVRGMAERAASPSASYAVALDANGQLQWRDGESVSHTEPATSAPLRLLVRLMGWLPIESYL